MAQKRAIMERLNGPDPAVPCEDCAALGFPDKYYLPDTWSAVKLPLLDEAGNPVYDKDGKARHTAVRLKVHVFPRSVLDPTGLIPVACSHGLKEHPNAEIQKARGRLAVSWVRSKYVSLGGKAGTSCTLCLDPAAEVPPDFYGATA